MSGLLVTFDAISAAPLAELERIVGLRGEGGSHNAGDPRRTGSHWDSSRLRVESDLDDDEPLIAHVHSLLAKVPRRDIPVEVEMMVTVAIFTEMILSSVGLDAKDVIALAERRWGFEVVSYLTTTATPRAKRTSTKS